MGYKKEKIFNLLVEKITGNISVADDADVERAIHENEEIRTLWLQMQKKHAVSGERFLNSLDDEDAWNKIKETIEDDIKHYSVFKYKKWLSIAATIVFMSAMSYYVFNIHYSQAIDQSLTVLHEKNPIKLKLADGRSILLENDGYIDLGTVKLTMAKGKLNYQSVNSSLDWNTISVPPMKDYKLVLSDGTEVWLNSASNLRFPFNFTGDKREVYLDGEAYFKVAENTERAFIVHTRGTDIKVLGTSFNVNSYNENITTSLVEGSIQNSSGNQSIILKPGHQSIYKPSIGFRQEEFEVEHVLSWMEGVYYFEDIPLETLSDVLWRWFKVNLIIDNPKIYHLTFTGAIEKDKSLNFFIENLETTSDIKGFMRGNELHLK